jgi:alpha-L-fucosidase
MVKNRIFITVAFALAMCMFSHGQTAVKERTPLLHGSHNSGKRNDEAMQKWRAYGLGQFIHWGVYAIPGGQWNGKTSTYAAEWFRTSGLITREEYDNLYRQFNPRSFDAVRWARQARYMGARYVIFTTKHHDGFCLWHSKYTDYTVEHTPYKKDIVKEIVDAYTAEGIDVYLYFSIIDWNHPGYAPGRQISAADRADWASYNPFRSEKEASDYETFKSFTRNQLVELLTDFPEIKGLWFDGSWDGAWMKQAAWVDSLGMELRAMHPGLIIGSRFRADENGQRHVDSNGDLIDDYDQRFERNLPATLEETQGFDWDCVMTVPENQWGYHRDWSLSYVKTSYELIEMMVKANSMDGNFVINFGPDGDGNIREEESRIARETGDWMKTNSAAVYGTGHSILDKHDWGYSTAKGDDVYLTVFNKPVNNLLRIKMPRAASRDSLYVIENATFIADGKNAMLRGGGKPATYYRDKSGTSYFDIVIPPKHAKSKLPFVIRIRLKQINKQNIEEYQQAII